MRHAGRIGFVNRGDYSETETYEFLHFVHYNGSTYVAKKTTIGNEPVYDNEYWHILASGGELQRTSDVSDTEIINPSEYGGRVNISDREKMRDFAGKVKKWFADLKPVAFSGKYTDLESRVTVTNNDLATVPGTAWDAYRGAQIRKDVDKLNSDLSGAKGIRLVTRYIDALSTDENGLIYYDLASPDDLPQYPAQIAQNSYYNGNDVRVVGTRAIANNTIRIYFSKKIAPLTVSVLYKL